MENKLLVSKKFKFGIYESALACLLFIIYNFMFSFVYSMIPDSITNNVVVNFVANFLLSTTFALTAITVAGTRHIDLKEATGVKHKINGKMVWICLGISLVALIGFSDITNLFMELLYALGYQSILPEIAITSFWEYLAYVVVTCATPAFCEEFLFRGTILSGLKDFGAKVAIFASAIIFTLMHGNAEQTVHQFIIGIILGVIFYKTKNLWLCVIIHFFNNFVAITLTYLMSLFSVGEQTVVQETASVGAMDIAVSIISMALFVYFGYYLVRLLIDKLVQENEILNPSNIENSSVEMVAVDGEVQEVEVVVEGEAIKPENKSDEKPVLSKTEVVMFAISGLYLVGNWLLALFLGLG